MQPIKVVFVDDDLEFGQMQSMGLTRLGYKVHFQTSLAGIEGTIRDFSPSIIVLDIEIGEENGIEKAKELIALFPEIPILFVSSHHDIDYITEGIAIGAVNYLKKPFETKELGAYIRRFANNRIITKEIPIGNYLLNSETRQLHYDGVLLGKLTPYEKNVLALLWKNKNKPVPLDSLCTEVWRKKYIVDVDQSIHNVISKLRKYLNKDEQVRIDTVRYEGYQLTIS